MTVLFGGTSRNSSVMLRDCHKLGFYCYEYGSLFVRTLATLPPTAVTVHALAY